MVFYPRCQGDGSRLYYQKMDRFQYRERSPRLRKHIVCSQPRTVAGITNRGFTPQLPA